MQKVINFEVSEGHGTSTSPTDRQTDRRRTAYCSNTGKVMADYIRSVMHNNNNSLPAQDLKTKMSAASVRCRATVRGR